MGRAGLGEKADLVAPRGRVRMALCGPVVGHPGVSSPLGITEAIQLA